MEIVCMRLQPGQDLRESLKTFAIDQALEAGLIVTALGSLSQATLRYAAQSETTLLTMPLELLTLTGTLSRYGLHLHGTVADAQGQVCGGHIMTGCLIRTTAEIAIARLPNLRLRREPDPQTGYQELVIEPLVVDRP